MAILEILSIGSFVSLDHTYRPAPAELAIGVHDSPLKTLFDIKSHPQSQSMTLAILLGQLQTLAVGVKSRYPFPDMTESGTWRNRLDAVSTGDLPCIHSHLIDENATIRLKMEISMDDHRLFKTLEGDLGYAPRSCAVGDQVWVLEKGKIPFILRSKCKTFGLIGEWYVHEIMD